MNTISKFIYPTVCLSTIGKKLISRSGFFHTPIRFKFSFQNAIITFVFIRFSIENIVCYFFMLLLVKVC